MTSSYQAQTERGVGTRFHIPDFLIDLWAGVQRSFFESVPPFPKNTPERRPYG